MFDAILCTPLQGFTDAQISTERFLNLRYDGTDVAVMTLCSVDGADPAAAFEDQARFQISYFVVEVCNFHASLRPLHRRLADFWWS